jgi:hypothetical protein
MYGIAEISDIIRMRGGSRKETEHRGRSDPLPPAAAFDHEAVTKPAGGLGSTGRRLSKNSFLHGIKELTEPGAATTSEAVGPRPQVTG